MAMRESDILISDLIKGHTESATSTKLLLKNISDVLAVMCLRLVTIEDFMKEIRSTRETFYKYTVRTFITIFLVQTIIIGLLLKELNVKGADAIKAVGSTIITIPR